MTFQILSVSGSLRAGSTNTGLIRLAQRLAPEGLIVRDPYPIADLPYYNSDLDTPETRPEVCQAWRDAVQSADAVLWAAPEYNYGPSGVLKNALDWLSKPMGANPLVGLVSSVVSSAGGGGGARVQDYLEMILGALGGSMVSEPAVRIKLSDAVVRPDGTVDNPEVEAIVSERLANILTHLEAH